MLSAILVVAAAVAFQPCDIQDQKGECGTVRVPENRAEPERRSIELNVARIRTHGPRSADPIFVLAGGPGAGATMTMADFAAHLFQGTGRDIVLVDMRGTGRSNPLRCEFGGSNADMQGYLNDFLPLDRVAACKDTLATRADLTQYTTRAAAADLEQVRTALGYPAVNLYGSSYGTRLAQELMRHYPKSIRLAILDGVVSPSMVSPATYAPDAEQSLRGIFKLCAADASCTKTYPQLAAEYPAMLERVANGIEVTVHDSETKRDVPLKLNRPAWRSLPQFPIFAGGLCGRAVDRASGRAGRLSRVRAGSAQLRTKCPDLDFGLFLSVTCTEEMSRIDAEAARRAAAGTLLGAYRIEQQAAACRIWPKGVADPARIKLLESSIPTLLLSGELDPVTPPRHAYEVARGLTQALHVVVPNGSHSGETGGCLEKLVADAVRHGSWVT